MSQLFVGFTTEGTTDTRLLESILLRTFEEVALECPKQIEVNNPIIHIKKNIGLDFGDNLFQCAKKAFEDGVMAFVVHVDADDATDSNVFETRINPGFQKIFQSKDLALGINLVPLVPVQMTEAWMLADKELLKDEIGTTKTDAELGLQRAPESYADPKSAIVNAIMIARQEVPKRKRKDLKIAELYQPIGQKIELRKLENLLSYQKFKEQVRQVYRSLNYLH